MNLKLNLDDKGLSRGFGDFKTANKIAVRNTLNTAAALTRRNAINKVKKEFTLRNTFTVRSIQFEKVQSNTISKMVSRAGALERASYMDTQETGGRRARKGSVTAIPQKNSRMGSSSSRIVSKARYISKIQPRIIKGSHSKVMPSHRAYGVSQMAMAYKKKMFLKRRNNIYFVESFVSRNGRVRARLKHLYNIQEKPLNIKKEKWLEPSTKRPSENLDKIYRGQLRKLWKYDALK